MTTQITPSEAMLLAALAGPLTPDERDHLEYLLQWPDGLLSERELDWEFLSRIHAACSVAVGKLKQINLNAEEHEMLARVVNIASMIEFTRWFQERIRWRNERNSERNSETDMKGGDQPMAEVKEEKKKKQVKAEKAVGQSYCPEKADDYLKKKGK